MIPGMQQDLRVLAESLADQPSLFAPEAASLIALAVVSPARGTYTAERIDEKKALLVGALKELGLSDRKIAELAGVARESIPVIVVRLEAEGKLRPVKERLTQWLGLLAEESTLAARGIVEKIRNGEFGEDETAALRGLGPVLGIATEKLQLMTGQATSISVQRVDPTTDDVGRWLEKGIKRVDSESSAKVLDVKELEIGVTGGVTGSVFKGAADQVAAGDPEALKGEGGGSRSAGDHTNSDGSGGAKFISNGHEPTI